MNIVEPTEWQKQMYRQVPFISVIIPVYNGEKFIQGCLESLLGQDYPQQNYEIIVVDNNSIDHTAEIVKQCPVQYIFEKRQGAAAARNTGASVAIGEGVMFFDADQVAEKNYMKNIILGWEDRQYGAFSGLNIAMGSEEGLLSDYWAKEWAVKRDGSRNRLSHFSGGLVLIRTDVFKKLRGFDEQFIFASCEDIDLSWRMQKDLGLLIRYNLDAISYHRERLTIKSLLKREFHFGYGDEQLGERHPEAVKSGFAEFFRGLKRTILGILVLIYRLLFYVMGRFSKKHFQLVLLDIVMKWVNFLGRMFRKFDHFWRYMNND